MKNNPIIDTTRHDTTRPLSVYFDYQILFAQRYGGISRYFSEIISRLPELGADVEISCIHNHNYYFSEKFGIIDTSGYNKFLMLAEKGIFWYMNRFKAFREIKGRDYDIIHPTYYYASYFEGISRGKIIITVHDMTVERYVNLYSELNKRLIPEKYKSVHMADRIIAVSESTKRDIIKFYPDINPEKISVIYHGASMNPSNKADNFSRMQGKDYILYVGDRRAYKNFSRFVQAMKEIFAVHKELNVFCAGGGAFTAKELESFGEIYKSRFYQAGLNDNELTAAYSDALCFVFPSEYEGFGIPILEAFACNCPVVCSNSSSLPEVAGDSAEYFDPLDVNNIAEKILHVIENEELRKNLMIKGRERLKLFNWNKTAKETLECYKIALNE